MFPDRAQMLPGPLPAFLRPLEEAYTQAGLQLRMLQRLQPAGSDIMDHMGASAAAEIDTVSALAASDTDSGSRAPGGGSGSDYPHQHPRHGLTAPGGALSFDPHTLLQVGRDLSACPAQDLLSRFIDVFYVLRSPW